MTRAKDAAQLVVAAQQHRVLVRHNANHYKLLHDAWRIWSREWPIAATHAGILILPHDQPAMIAQQIDVFLSLALPLRNELYFWKNPGEWTRYSSPLTGPGAAAIGDPANTPLTPAPPCPYNPPAHFAWARGRAWPATGRGRRSSAPDWQ
jgi:hypothetical protein